MTDHAKLGWIALLTGLLLLLYVVAFGETLPTRPEEYTPVDYLSASCSGVSTDTTLFRFGVDGDVRWVEIYVEDHPGHQQLAAVATFDPGPSGQLTSANVLLPSGQVMHYASMAALEASPFESVCQVAAAWLNRT